MKKLDEINRKKYSSVLLYLENVAIRLVFFFKFVYIPTI